MRFSDSVPGQLALAYVEEDGVRHYLIKPEDLAAKKSLPEFLMERSKLTSIVKLVSPSSSSSSKSSSKPASKKSSSNTSNNTNTTTTNNNNNNNNNENGWSKITKIEDKVHALQQFIAKKKREPHSGKKNQVDTSGYVDRSNF